MVVATERVDQEGLGRNTPFIPPTIPECQPCSEEPEKEHELDIVVHTCDPSTELLEAEGLGHEARSCLKSKSKGEGEGLGDTCL